LPSNLAVAVHPELDYVKILANGHQYILAEARLEANFKEYEVLERFKGKTLKNKRYKPLFLYFADRQDEKSFRVLTDDFVTIEDGTGVVHLAPAFGEVDFFICQREGIEHVCPVDQNVRYTAEVPDYQGI